MLANYWSVPAATVMTNQSTAQMSRDARNWIVVNCLILCPLLTWRHMRPALKCSYTCAETDWVDLVQQCQFGSCDIDFIFLIGWAVCIIIYANTQRIYDCVFTKIEDDQDDIHYAVASDFWEKKDFYAYTQPVYRELLDTYEEPLKLVLQKFQKN